MTNQTPPLTGVERFLDKDDIIVSKTDLKGRILYANRTFIDIADYKESELIGAPHSIVRHPDMPRCVFKLLWDTIEAKGEIFAYVINKAKNGDHYWVFAHVTPSFDNNGKLVGYHSSRRAVDKNIVDNTIIPLYKTLRDEENRHSNRKEGMNSATNIVLNLLEENGVSYNEFIFSLL